MKELRKRMDVPAQVLWKTTLTASFLYTLNFSRTFVLFSIALWHETPGNRTSRYLSLSH
jgi:hypothetical protein